MSKLYYYAVEHMAPSPRERPDGDTVKVRVDLGMQIERITKFRLARINCPELNTVNGSGLAARDFLRTLWPIGTMVSAQTLIDPTDKFGRWIAEVTLQDGTNLSDRMVQAGHAIYKVY